MTKSNYASTNVSANIANNNINNPLGLIFQLSIQSQYFFSLKKQLGNWETKSICPVFRIWWWVADWWMNSFCCNVSKVTHFLAFNIKYVLYESLDFVDPLFCVIISDQFCDWVTLTYCYVSAMFTKFEHKASILKCSQRDARDSDCHDTLWPTSRLSPIVTLKARPGFILCSHV